MKRGDDVLRRLAGAKGRRDYKPNAEVAERVARAGDAAAVARLVEGLREGNARARSDSLHALGEIARMRPTLAAPHAGVFFTLLRDRNNRLAWGGMIALEAIAAAEPRAIAPRLPEIVRAANEGSVITRDNAVKILIHCAAIPTLRPRASRLLMQQLEFAPENQFSRYAIDALPFLTPTQQKKVFTFAERRLADELNPHRRRRLEELLRLAGGNRVARRGRRS
jgi:hypothetical protein